MRRVGAKWTGEHRIVIYDRFFFFFQAEDGIRDDLVTGVQTCALPISWVYRSYRGVSRTNRIGRPQAGLLSDRRSAVRVGPGGDRSADGGRGEGWTANRDRKSVV